MLFFRLVLDFAWLFSKIEFWHASTPMRSLSLLLSSLCRLLLYWYLLVAILVLLILCLWCFLWFDPFHKHSFHPYGSLPLLKPARDGWIPRIMNWRFVPLVVVLLGEGGIEVGPTCSLGWVLPCGKQDRWIGLRGRCCSVNARHHAVFPGRLLNGWFWLFLHGKRVRTWNL